jgi:hypothetical protein
MAAAGPNDGRQRRNWMKIEKPIGDFQNPV